MNRSADWYNDVFQKRNIKSALYVAKSHPILLAGPGAGGAEYFLRFLIYSASLVCRVLTAQRPVLDQARDQGKYQGPPLSGPALSKNMARKQPSNRPVKNDR